MADISNIVRTTNEENGVVYIPKFIIDNLVKEMTDVEVNQKKEDEKNG